MSEIKSGPKACRISLENGPVLASETVECSFSVTVSDSFGDMNEPSLSAVISGTAGDARLLAVVLTLGG